MEQLLVLFVVLGITTTLLAHFLRKSSRTSPFPPGPPPDLVIGNLRQIPKHTAWKTYLEWSRIYNSDVVSCIAFGKRVVILNSAQAVSDLIDKRGTIYADRDHNVMLEDLIGFDNILFMSYDETFRLQRKVINTALNPTAARNYYAIQEKETYALINRLLETPDQWIDHVRRAANSIILTMTYGHEVTTEDDYLVKLSERAMTVIRLALQPGSFLVNFVPALKYLPAWLPGLQFKSFAREGRKLRTELKALPWKEIKEQIASGVALPSYVTTLLERKGTITGDPKVDEEELIMATASIMYGAGSDTTIAAVMNVILALIFYPDVQKKAQAEIDAVIGSSRLPSFADLESLPYLHMVLAESLRWNPVTAISIPHRARQDDVYKGMLIPKDSVVLPNIWALLHDPNTYPDPHTFWPERFDGRFPNTRHPRSFAFGFNRRLCPGRHLAMNSLFIQVANLLAVYNFSRPRDEHGNEVDPVVDYSLNRPKPFKCTITPRSNAAIALIRSTDASTAT